jgi:hypothetical protein
MGELLRDATAALLTAAGGLLIAYLIWITATSKFFVTISTASLFIVALALILAVTVLALIGVIVWWIALLVAVVDVVALLAALPPVVSFGLSRVKTQLRETFPSHWEEGVAKGQAAAESLAARPDSSQEARRLEEELKHTEEKAHVRQYHAAGEEACFAFSMAFSDAFWVSLRSSGWAPVWSSPPSLGRHFTNAVIRHFSGRRRRTWHIGRVRLVRVASWPLLTVTALTLLVFATEGGWVYWVAVGILARIFWVLLGEVFGKRIRVRSESVANVGQWLAAVMTGLTLLFRLGYGPFAGLAATAVCRLEWVLLLSERRRSD